MAPRDHQGCVLLQGWVLLQGCVLLLACLGCQATVLHSTFARIGGSNKRYAVSEVNVSLQASPASCARQCVALQPCVAFNLRQESALRFSCELLSFLPLSPTASLQDNLGWSYFEKGCSQSYGLVAAGDGPLEGVEMTTGQTAVSLALNGGRDLYTAIFRPDLVLHALQQGPSLATTFGGLYLGLAAIAKVPVDMTGTELDFFTRGNEINVTIEPSNTRAQGFPRPLQEVGISGARALLLSPTGNDLLAFRSGEVVTLAVTFTAPDKVSLAVKEVLRVGRSETHKWRLAPPDVTSAAWLQSNDGVASREMAFLATPDFYVIVNATSGVVKQRERLCP